MIKSVLIYQSNDRASSEKNNNDVHHYIEEGLADDSVRTLSQKRKRSVDETHINSSSSSSAPSSVNAYFEEASAKIDAATTQYLLELKEKRAQAALEHSAAVARIIQQSNDIDLQRQKEELRHQQKLAANAREQHELIEKADSDLLHQSKLEAYNRSLKSREKRLEWAQAKEKEDYSEQQRRDAQDYEDERKIRLLRAERQMEQEDRRQEFERQQKTQRQSYDRELDTAVIMDTLRKGKVGEANTRLMLTSIFNKQEEDNAALQENEESESEGSAKKATSYKPYNPFGDSAQMF